MQILAALHVAIFYSGKTGGGALWPLPQQVKRCAIFPVVGRYVYCVDIEACLDLFCPLCHRLGVFFYIVWQYVFRAKGARKLFTFIIFRSVRCHNLAVNNVPCFIRRQSQ